MMKQLHLLALPILPLVVGVLIGYAWCGAARLESTQARAAEPKAAKDRAPTVQRFGSVVGVNRETLDQYVILHKHVWPEVLKCIRKANIRNYSIYLGELDDENLYLFSYFEYVGDDFEADMASIGEDPVTREWWKLTDPLQKRLRNTPTGDQWKGLKEVFHAN